jgi:very-short-patch-repair endonuclease
MLLRDRRFALYKFRRQVPLGGYVVDFACYKPRLVVELDGAQHANDEQAAFDAKRTAELKAAGFHVVRVWNGDLYRDRDGAMAIIWNGLQAAKRRE